MFVESVVIALDGIRANKLRAMLTMLGIIIGVGAVIAMVSIGMGVQDKVQTSIAGLGSNLLVVTPGAAKTGGSRQAAGSSITLNEKDALDLNPDDPRYRSWVHQRTHGSSGTRIY